MLTPPDTSANIGSKNQVFYDSNHVNGKCHFEGCGADAPIVIAHLPIPKMIVPAHHSLPFAAMIDKLNMLDKEADTLSPILARQHRNRGQILFTNASEAFQHRFIFLLTRIMT